MVYCVECGSTPNVIVALPNIGGALCSTRAKQDAKPVEIRCQVGCPKLPDRSQPLVGRSASYCGDPWKRYCCLASFFPIVDVRLNFEDIARQICAMVSRWRFLASFCVLYFQRAACSKFQTCILNSH